MQKSTDFSVISESRQIELEYTVVKVDVKNINDNVEIGSY